VKPFMQDGHILALRAVRAVLGRDCALTMVIESIETVDWASATFVGKRHICELRLEAACAELDQAVERLSRDLPEAEVATTRYFLADVALTGSELSVGKEECCARITIEALTIEV